MSQKVVFWLAPNEILIPADQVPGAIAETFYPPVTRDSALNDPNAVERLKAEREHSQKLSEQYPNLPDDYKFSVGDLSSYLAGLSLEIEVRHGSPTSIEAAEHTIGWYDATLSAAMWFGLISVGSQEAAMLLCRFNPQDNKCDPLTDSTDETSPDDYKRLLRVLEDVANAESQPRSLIQWLAVAKDKGLKYHSWIDNYANALLLTATTPVLASENNNSGPVCTKKEIIDGFDLTGKDWGDILGRPNREGLRYKPALAQLGRPGRAPGGKSAPSMWYPIIFARLLIQNNDLNPGQVKARFKKAWPKFEAEMLAEIGDL